MRILSRQITAPFDNADFEKAIGDYLTFEFSMIMQNREYLFGQGGEENAEP